MEALSNLIAETWEARFNALGATLWREPGLEGWFSPTLSITFHVPDPANPENDYEGMDFDWWGDLHSAKHYIRQGDLRPEHQILTPELLALWYEFLSWVAVQWQPYYEMGKKKKGFEDQVRRLKLCHRQLLQPVLGNRDGITKRALKQYAMKCGLVEDAAEHPIKLTPFGEALNRFIEDLGTHTLEDAEKFLDTYKQEIDHLEAQDALLKEPEGV